jgi:caffeoyl-CoA O-methyltransferase
MTKEHPPWLDPAVFAYISDHSAPPDQILLDLVDETASMGPVSNMQICIVQGAFMQLVVRLTGARHIVEVGTFTGYSALCIARALPDDGHLLCCDVSEKWTAIAQRAWKRAGVSHKIDLRIAPAIDTLHSLPADHRIDLAFIDADKPSYLAYYEELLSRLKPNGLILIDNTLWDGLVLKEPAHDDHNTKALRALNDFVAADPRVDSFILPIGDGLTMVRKY